MWFKDALRRILKLVNTEPVGEGVYSSVETDGKKVYIFSKSDDIDLGKIVLWEAYNRYPSKYYPPLQHEEVLIDGKIITVFSSPKYIVPIPDDDKYEKAYRQAIALRKIFYYATYELDITDENNKDVPPPDIFMDIIDHPENWTYPHNWNDLSLSQLSNMLPKGLKDALGRLYRISKHRNKRFNFDLGLNNMGTTEKGQLKLIDPIVFLGGYRL